MLKKILFVIVCAMGLTACTNRTTHMDLIVPQNLDIKHQNLRTSPVQKNVIGEDSAPVFIFIPLGFPNFETVVAKTLKNGNGNAIVNAKIEYITNWYILFGVNKIRLTGDVVNVGGAQ